MLLPDPGRHRTFHRSAAVSDGFTDMQLRRATDADQLRRLYRGSYARSASHDALDESARHLDLVCAALAAQRTLSVVSHQSAAALHGLPLWGIDLSTVHLTQQRRNAGRRSHSLHVHTAPLGDDEVTSVGGLAVTTATRTVFDLACAVPFEQAVVVADAALHARVTSPEQLARSLLRGRGRQGRHRAEAAIAFADGRAESVGESRSRVGMHRAGLIAPGLQFTVFRADGTVAGRSDFDWQPLPLLGEFDGLSKYGRLRRPGETPGDAVAREKAREDELRDLGNEFVRWVWVELSRPERLYPMKIQPAITRALKRLG